MAEFKRALGSDSGGPAEGLGFGFDGATMAALGDASAAFWPLILGVVIVLLMIIRGDEKAVIPVAGGVVLLQAWQSGLFQ